MGKAPAAAVLLALLVPEEEVPVMVAIAELLVSIGLEGSSDTSATLPELVLETLVCSDDESESDLDAAGDSSVDVEVAVADLLALLACGQTAPGVHGLIEQQPTKPVV